MELFELGQLRQLATPVAQHEMGHFVAATVLGFSTGDVTIKILGPLGGYNGGATINLGHGHSSLESLEQYLVARIQVLYAGCVAQSITQQPSIKIDAEQAVELLRGEPGKDDYAKGRELFHVLRGIRWPDGRAEMANR